MIRKLIENNLHNDQMRVDFKNFLPLQDEESDVEGSIDSQSLSSMEGNESKHRSEMKQRILPFILKSHQRINLSYIDQHDMDMDSSKRRSSSF